MRAHSPTLSTCVTPSSTAANLRALEGGGWGCSHGRAGSIAGRAGEGGARRVVVRAPTRACGPVRAVVRQRGRTQDGGNTLANVQAALSAYAASHGGYPFSTLMLGSISTLTLGCDNSSSRFC